MTKLYEVNVKLGNNQKQKLSSAYQKLETITLRVTNKNLVGKDTLHVPITTINRINKSKKGEKGVDIRLSKTNIRKQVGGSLLTTILSLARTALPTIAKTIGLSALSGGVSGLVDKGIKGSGLFSVPQSKVNKLIEYKDYLTTAQKKQIIGALQTGEGIKRFRVTKSLIGSLLASIGIPIVIDLAKKLFGGGVRNTRRRKAPRKKGGAAPRLGPPWVGEGAMQLRSPPFYGTVYGPPSMRDCKKTKTSYWPRTITGGKQSIQRRSHIRSNTLKPKFYRNRALSNFDLLDWCKYLNIPINNVLSRDESSKHSDKHALYIYNLEPLYMEGSHWVSTFTENNIINYFDSFGMPPLQEIVDHSTKKKLTLQHQNHQIQSFNTTTCGYFCLYFLNEMSKGNTYFDLLKRFDLIDTNKNEVFIGHYFRNMV